MDLDIAYPALSDFRRAARRRMPNFVFAYLDSATGDRELGMAVNRMGLDAVGFIPSILHGKCEPELTTRLFGFEFARPFGMAPLGMSGLIWPDAERLLAAEAQKARLPYCLSTVATRIPEDVGPVAGDMGWFQLYPPADPEIRRDMIRRARASGFQALIVTVDVPADSRRERQRRAHLTIPPKITPGMAISMLLHPAWTLGSLRIGKPSLKLAEEYHKPGKTVTSVAHAGHAIRGAPDWDILRQIRSEWDGPLMVKGVLKPDDARRLVDCGIDGIWVSNHSARQFEAAPAAISCVGPVRDAIGPDIPLIFDSGIEGGLDIMRALALGADFVMLGRAWHYALAALGPRGVRHLVHVLTDDLAMNMAMVGARNPAALRALPVQITPCPVPTGPLR